MEGKINPFHHHSRFQRPPDRRERFPILRGERTSFVPTGIPSILARNEKPERFVISLMSGNPKRKLRRFAADAARQPSARQMPARSTRLLPENRPETMNAAFRIPPAAPLRLHFDPVAA
jgi:hypothetical protein